MSEKLKIKRIPLKAYTKKELRMFYGLSKRTFNEWLEQYKEELKVIKGYYLNVNQVQFIFEKFGVPGEIDVE